MKTHKNQLGTMKIPPETMKNHKNLENQPGTLKNYKTNLEPKKSKWNHEKP